MAIYHRSKRFSENPCTCIHAAYVSSPLGNEQRRNKGSYNLHGENGSGDDSMSRPSVYEWQIMVLFI